jgi:hypothetical protein
MLIFFFFLTIAHAYPTAREEKILLLPRHPNADAAKWGEAGFKQVVEEGEVLPTSTSARWSR